jgi:tRNA threonylcarbamoyl adenosine modification protein (Sua5/YciO/YrdC/YwlC family)
VASDEQRAVDAIRRGEPVLLPTDGVYGLCAAAGDEAAVLRLAALKGRAGEQPIALIASGVDALLASLPELRGRAEAMVRGLLPGPYTLVLPNPARRYAWLSGSNPNTIGVRVALLPASTQRVLDAAGPVAATSANRHGEPAAASLDDVPPEIRAACGAELDGGRLSGLPSTVLDLTGEEPVVLREGAVPSAEAIARVRGRR